jgi:opacity protein-like surface antigen
MIPRAMCLVVLLASTASAADERSAGVGGTVSALNIDSGTALSFSGAFAFRFGRVVGLELDATMAPTLKSPFPNGPVTILDGSRLTWATVLPGSSAASLQIFPSPMLTNPGGRALIFSNNVRVAIPTTARRLEPFFVAGGGIASVRHTADLVYNPILLTPNPPSGIILPAPTLRTITQHVTSSEIDLALTLGGGLSVRTTSQLWIDADLRLIRLLGDEDRNVGRFGVGVGYRF